MMESVYLALAGALGSFLKSWATHSQGIRSKETVIDVVVGALVGILYPLYPLIPLHAGMTLIQKAAMVALVAYASSDFIQGMVTKVQGQLGK